MRQNVEVKTQTKEADVNLEINYRLIELYILLYKKMSLESTDFDVDFLINSISYKSWKRQYDKKIKCNTCSFIKNDENKIIFEALIDLAETFTPFQRDFKLKQRQIEYFQYKDQSLLLSNEKGNKKNNFLYLIEMFTRLRLNIISQDKLVNSNIYNNFLNEETKKSISNNYLVHDKMKILVDLILLLENKQLINNVKNRSFIK